MVVATGVRRGRGAVRLPRGSGCLTGERQDLGASGTVGRDVVVERCRGMPAYVLILATVVGRVDRVRESGQTLSAVGLHLIVIDERICVLSPGVAGLAEL